jgi:hypothetical protein
MTSLIKKGRPWLQGDDEVADADGRGVRLSAWELLLAMVRLLGPHKRGGRRWAMLSPCTGIKQRAKSWGRRQSPNWQPAMTVRTLGKWGCEWELARGVVNKKIEEGRGDDFKHSHVSSARRFAARASNRGWWPRDGVAATVVGWRIMWRVARYVA